VLRRAENVSVGFVRRPLTRWGFVTATIGRDVHRIGWGSRDEYERASAVSLQQPQFVIAHRGRTYWQYRGRFWWDDAGLTAFQVHALITSREDRQRAQVERAEEIFSMGGLAQDRPRQRRQIPDDVKHLVWLRDRGQCQNCGASTELQFDHVIPFATGGAASAENLQLLCGPCNRRKGARVSVG
jgi:hypothetical protein